MGGLRRLAKYTTAKIRNQAKLNEYPPSILVALMVALGIICGLLAAIFQFVAIPAFVCFGIGYWLLYYAILENTYKNNGEK